jgi:hypothetical protein
MSVVRMKQDRRAAVAAARNARFRQRRRKCRYSVRIEYPEALPLALVDAGWLQQWDDNDPAAIAKAIENVLIAMCSKQDYEA